MELGIGMFGDLRINEKTGYKQTPQERLEEILEEVKLMDEVGLDFFGIGEHHRPDYSVSSPEIVLAAAAAVTKNIKLGSAVSVISSTDPVKLYQDFSMIDNISNGRAEIMAGRGSFIESFPLFGSTVSGSHLTEILAVTLQCLQRREIRHLWLPMSGRRSSTALQ